MNTTIDKAPLRRALTESFNRFMTSFDDFNDAEINRVPFPGSWTPAQVASHIILATDGVPDHNTKAANRSADAFLKKIRPWWEDLNQKFQSPEPLRPDDKPRDKHELLAELHRVKEKDLALVDNAELSAVCLDFELPSIGYLTRYEWLWFIEMHLNRHTFQLNNIRGKMI